MRSDPEQVTPKAEEPVVNSGADIRFNWPRCGQHLAVEQRGAGMAVNCPTCNEHIEIPRRNGSLT
jgi:hypothetical protein